MLVEDSFEELKLKIKMYKKEVPKLNKENFPTWQSLMNLHIARIGDTTWTSIENRYIVLTGTLFAQELKEKREHN